MSVTREQIIKSTNKQMPRKRSKTTTETLTFNPFEIDPSEFADLAKTERLSEFGIYPMPGGRGVNFGRRMQPDEQKGEGLPELAGDRGEIMQWNLNLDIRVSCDTDGNTYFEIAWPGRGTFHQFKLEGIDFGNVRRAAINFNNSFETFLNYWGINLLFEGLYWEHGEKKDREDAYDKIIKNFKNYFKSILKSKRKREIETREVRPGVKITVHESIDTGREPETEAEKEQQKQKFISDVFAALDTIDREGGKRTMLDVGAIIFEASGSEDVQSLMKNNCRKFSLKWNDLLNDFKSKKSVKN